MQKNDGQRRSEQLHYELSARELKNAEKYWKYRLNTLNFDIFMYR